VLELHCTDLTVGLRDNLSETKSNVFLVEFKQYKNVNLIQTTNKFGQPSHPTKSVKRLVPHEVGKQRFNSSLVRLTSIDKLIGENQTKLIWQHCRPAVLGLNNIVIFHGSRFCLT